MLHELKLGDPMAIRRRHRSCREVTSCGWARGGGKAQRRMAAAREGTFR
jgi:hypothetical protein